VLTRQFIRAKTRIKNSMEQLPPDVKADMMERINNELVVNNSKQIWTMRIVIIFVVLFIVYFIYTNKTTNTNYNVEN
jgi:uncharacterized integral membrane protein